MFYRSHSVLGTSYTLVHLRSSERGWGGGRVGEVGACARGPELGSQHLCETLDVVSTVSVPTVRQQGMQGRGGHWGLLAAVPARSVSARFRTVRWRATEEHS